MRFLYGQKNIEIYTLVFYLIFNKYFWFLPFPNQHSDDIYHFFALWNNEFKVFCTLEQ